MDVDVQRAAEAARFRVDEMKQLQSMERTLWSEVFAGRDTPYVRARIQRLEALRSALCGFSAEIAAEPPCACRQDAA